MIYWKSFKYLYYFVGLDHISVLCPRIEVLAQCGLYLTRELRDHVELWKHDEVIGIVPADLRGGVNDLYLKIGDILHTEHMIRWHF